MNALNDKPWFDKGTKLWVYVGDYGDLIVSDTLHHALNGAGTVIHRDAAFAAIRFLQRWETAAGKRPWPQPSTDIPNPPTL